VYEDIDYKISQTATRIGFAVVASTGARFVDIRVVIVALDVRIVVDQHIHHWETRPTAVPRLTRLGRHRLLLTMGRTNPLLAGCPHFCRHAVTAVPRQHVYERKPGELQRRYGAAAHIRTHVHGIYDKHTPRAEHLSHTHIQTWTQGYRGKAVMARRVPRRVRVLPGNWGIPTPKCGL
jgi:hypothetical protein